MLGCLNNRRDFDSTNANSTLATVLTSQELFRIQGIPDALALGSVYGPDGYANFDEPDDVRTVNTAFTPEYFADELQLQAHLDQAIGAMNLSLGIYQETTVDCGRTTTSACSIDGLRYGPQHAGVLRGEWPAHRTGSAGARIRPRLERLFRPDHGCADSMAPAASTLRQ